MLTEICAGAAAGAALRSAAAKVDRARVLR
jgi:hypothetical protein